MADFNKQNQSLVELGFVLALIAVVIVTIIGRFGASVGEHDSKRREVIHSVTKLTPEQMETRCNKMGSTYSAADGCCQ